MWCIFGHKWMVDNVYFTPPAHHDMKLSGLAFGVTERLLRLNTEGVTHVYMRCKRCGELHSYDVYGNYQPSELERETS